MPEDTQLSDLLLRWEEVQEQGRDLSAEELAAGRPELLEPLRRQIQALRALGWVKEPAPPASTGLPSTGEGPAPGAATGPTPPAVLAGRYRLERLIAEGGFGNVWEGYDLQGQKRVAVKVAKAHRVVSAQQRATFLEEAQRAARLRHPGIVAVHDVGQHDGTYYIVADLVEGTDLAGWLRRQRPSPREAARLVADLARLLQHAHEKGVIHRDVKPANVLLDGAGRVFLTDFGIAVTQGQLQQRGVDCSGTLAYMAPEQAACDSGRIDARTDVYGLGVLLYELLAGRLPFEAATPAALREQVLHHPPGPLDGAVPPELERICLKCLAKEPGERYRTARDLAADLERYLRESNS
jgi:serine/threonine protein kinase